MMRGPKIEYSFNSQSNLDNNTKILIVGTFTSPLGIYNGYFYGAQRNCVYKRLDELFNTGNIFQTLKKRLIETNNKKEVVEQINKELSERNIAFLMSLKNAKGKFRAVLMIKILKLLDLLLIRLKKKVVHSNLLFLLLIPQKNGL